METRVVKAAQILNRQRKWHSQSLKLQMLLISIGKVMGDFIPSLVVEEPIGQISIPVMGLMVRDTFSSGHLIRAIDLATGSLYIWKELMRLEDILEALQMGKSHTGYQLTMVPSTWRNNQGETISHTLGIDQQVDLLKSHLKREAVNG